MVENPPVNAGDLRDAGSIPGSGRSPGEGKGNPLRYSCLGNPMDRGAWRATVHGIPRVRHNGVTKHSTSPGAARVKGFPGGARGKEPACQCWRHERCGFNAWTGKIPWRRKWQPTPVFSPGESHGQRILVGYRPWGLRESHTT